MTTSQQNDEPQVDHETLPLGPKKEQESETDPSVLSKESLELPMTVQLKGYEDYFPDFSWDAKKVMEVLGIKRSRLNQISGEELRVGKARIDRYLRPIYRPEDVQKYLEWTKPTASHKRSTNIIDQARNKLDKTSEDLKTSLLGQHDILNKEMTGLLNQTTKDITENTNAIQENLFRKLKKLDQKAHEYKEHEAKYKKKRDKEIEEQQENILKSTESFKANQSLLSEKMTSLIDSIEFMTDKFSQVEDEQVELREKLEEALDIIQNLKNRKSNSLLALSERKKIKDHDCHLIKNLSYKNTKPLSLLERKKTRPRL